MRSRSASRNTDCTSGVCGTDSRCGAPVTGLPDSTGAQVYNIDPGAGLVVQPGTQAGYGICTGNTGGTYRIVWTGEAAAGGASYNSFYGHGLLDHRDLRQLHHRLRRAVSARVR